MQYSVQCYLHLKQYWNIVLISFFCRPGFTRINLAYFIDDDTIEFVIQAVDDVTRWGWKLLPQVWVIKIIVRIWCLIVGDTCYQTKHRNIVNYAMTHTIFPYVVWLIYKVLFSYQHFILHHCSNVTPQCHMCYFKCKGYNANC